ncbi:hypothetical protein IW261DRAFT_1418491 [Armillaria novae-zelandiae]|uniref:Uncharacterized protein n=1 Tax=Armillaria novae-zelandiae TaxID=153914 RepID=A0AA39PDM2_9AGAR|nr:hypothetical protein IW261DRAFT_1418491 [Armillaria novae-zelandiae]
MACVVRMIFPLADYPTRLRSRIFRDLVVSIGGAVSASANPYHEQSITCKVQANSKLYAHLVLSSYLHPDDLITGNSGVVSSTTLHRDGSMDFTRGNQTSHHGGDLSFESQRQLSAYYYQNLTNFRNQTGSQGVMPTTSQLSPVDDNSIPLAHYVPRCNEHQRQYDDILQPTVWDGQPRPDEYLGHNNNRSQQLWEQSVHSDFPAEVGLDSHSTASFGFYQHWDGTSAPAQTVPTDPGQGVVSLETASPSPGTVDPIQCGSNMSKIFDGYVRRRFGNETTQKIAENWGISPECVFYLFPVIDVRCVEVENALAM